VFIFKIPGPMAEAGKNLDTIEVVIKEVYASMVTMGLVLGLAAYLGKGTWVAWPVTAWGYTGRPGWEVSLSALPGKP
jgi:sorbitol-specific phosphotransferase system component IIBC